MKPSEVREQCDKEFGLVYRAVGELSKIKQADVQNILNQLPCSEAIIVYEDFGKSISKDGVPLPSRGQLSIYVNRSEPAYKMFLGAQHPNLG